MRRTSSFLRDLTDAGLLTFGVHPMQVYVRQRSTRYGRLPAQRVRESDWSTIEAAIAAMDSALAKVREEAGIQLPRNVPRLASETLDRLSANGWELALPPDSDAMVDLRIPGAEARRAFSEAVLGAIGRPAGIAPDISTGMLDAAIERLYLLGFDIRPTSRARAY